ncbi:hypothetical protein V8E51_010136 [Hyaloscypha variabilis]
MCLSTAIWHSAASIEISTSHPWAHFVLLTLVVVGLVGRCCFQDDCARRLKLDVPCRQFSLCSLLFGSNDKNTLSI